MDSAFLTLDYLSASLFPFLWAGQTGVLGDSAGTAAAQFVLSSMPAEEKENTPFCTTTFPPCALRGILSRFFSLPLPLSFPSLGRGECGVFFGLSRGAHVDSGSQSTPVEEIEIVLFPFGTFPV